MGALEWRKEADGDWRPQLTTAVISLLLLEREVISPRGILNAVRE